MARSFRFNAPAADQQAASQDTWKAAGFINFYMPGGETGTTKLGAIPLRLANPDEKRLLEWLKADKPIEVPATDDTPAHTMRPIEYLLAAITVDFREVKADGNRFALPGMDTGKPAQQGKPPF